MNMTIDEPTLMVVLGLASITASAMFLTLHTHARDIAGVRTWAFGSLAVGFATLLDGPRLVADWQLASLLFNIPFAVGHALFLVGALEFTGRHHHRLLLPSMAGAAVLLTVLFTLLIPDTVLRIGSLSTFQAWANGWTAWVLWTNASASAPRAYRVAASVVLAQALAALAQVAFVLMSSVAVSYAAPELPLANIITWLGTMANVLIGNWILFLLIMLRLVGNLRALAANDVLTGLLNRRGLRSHIDGMLAQASPGTPVAVLLLDIDHFKRINDSNGHEVGDRVLARMGDVMRSLCTPQAVPCRWGGEEFCYVCHGMSDHALLALAEATRAQFASASKRETGLAEGASVSIGIATTPVVAKVDFSQLVARADAQLYLAKQRGRNRVCFSAADEVARVVDFTI